MRKAWVGAFLLLVSTVVSAKDETMHSYQFENDLFANTDRHYTNGFRYTFMKNLDEPTRDQAPFWIRWLGLSNIWTFKHDPGAEPTSYGMTKGRGLGNLMYTPRDITEENIIEDDRPYGGWLFYSELFQAHTKNKRHAFELQLGVTGKPSLTEYFQKGVHWATGSDRPEGWDNQIDFEPGFNFIYLLERRWLQAYVNDGTSRVFDLSTHTGFTVGTIFSYVSAAVTARVGWNLPSEFGPTTMRPSAPDVETDVELYAFVSAEGRGVVHNIFLEGSLFQDNPHTVDAESFVYDVIVGGVVRVKRYRLTYSLVERSEEFTLQDGNQRYGSLTMTYSKDF